MNVDHFGIITFLLLILIITLEFYFVSKMILMIVTNFQTYFGKKKYTRNFSTTNLEVEIWIYNVKKWADLARNFKISFFNFWIILNMIVQLAFNMKGKENDNEKKGLKEACFFTALNRLTLFPLLPLFKYTFKKI